MHFFTFTLGISSILEIPPLAITFALSKSQASLRNSRSGPSKVPSRLTLVKRNSVNPTCEKFLH